MYTNAESINSILTDISKIKDEDIERFKNWIYQILSHKKNENNITMEIFDNIGLTDIITITLAIMGFITRRISNMTEILGVNDSQKKTMIQ
jgi:hypothetical protein